MTSAGIAAVKHQQVDSPRAAPQSFGCSHSGQRCGSRGV